MKCLALVSKGRPGRRDIGGDDKGFGGPAKLGARRRNLVGAERRSVGRRRALLVRRAKADDHPARDQRGPVVGERGVDRAADIGGIVPVTAFHVPAGRGIARSEEHTSEPQSLMRLSYAVFSLKTKKDTQ